MAQVISESVGGMNESLAKTDAGKQQQMANALGDIKEQIGGMLEPLKGCIALFAETGYSVTYIIQLYSAIRSATSALGLMITKEKLHNALMAVTNTVTKTVKVSMMALNAVLNGNPIGLVVGVIAALVTSLKLAYEKSDKFRQVCDVLYSSIKNVGKWIYDKLTPAFNTLCDAVKSVWNYLAPLFGLNPSMESIKNEVAQTGEAFDESSDSVRKYLEMMKNAGDGSKTKVEVKPVAGSIDALQKVVNDLNQKLNAASEADRATIVADLVFAEDALKKAQEKLDQQKFEARYTLKPVEMMSESDFLTGIKNPRPSLKEGLDKIKLPSLPTKDIYTMNDALADSTSMFRSLGQAAGGAFGSVMNYLSGVLQTLPNLIAQLRTVFVAQTSTAAVSAAAGQAQQGPWGWLGVGAAIAATLAAVASIPKFANGAIAYGPTLGLFGEYAGASNNPEVVAPLDKLQSMISTDGGFGKVEFVIDGRVLKGILKKVEHLDYRSR